MIANMGLRLVMACLALSGAAFAQSNPDFLGESKFAKAGSQAVPNCRSIQGGPNGYICVGGQQFYNSQGLPIGSKYADVYYCNEGAASFQGTCKDDSRGPFCVASASGETGGCQQNA